MAVHVSLSADGNTLAVGAIDESSAATGVNGDQADNSVARSGAAYVFARISGEWQQQAYIKASNPDENDFFGSSVSVSSDGNTLTVVAFGESSAATGINGDQADARGEDSAATGINGDQADNSAPSSGAAYVFARTSGEWQQQAYVKASNADFGDFFGGSVSVSADGNTLAVGASKEDSDATGINSEQQGNPISNSGAVYIY